MENLTDLIVLGSGVAGLAAAVRAAQAGMTVRVITKGNLNDGTTRWAQGGVAAAMNRDPEALDIHLADTLQAGAGLCDAAAVRVLVDEGPVRVAELIDLGAQFDRDPDGTFQLAREGGHSVFRILHAGGAATGWEVERALVAAARQRAISIHEHHFALDLIVEDGRCRGLTVLDATDQVVEMRATHVLMAAGGAGQMWSITTNPTEATGDGVAMALRAGVAVADLEFFQFHPTALAVDAMPRPLLTEALRGHGAHLLSAAGKRFVNELLPRDKVSRAIMAQAAEDGSDHVWLDCRMLRDFRGRFANIAESLDAVGLDPSTDLLPVAPAAHHQCGGVLTDLRGATSLPGLWAAGETCSTGVHGANRLASNSLLEGLVFGPRAVEAIIALDRSGPGSVDGPSATGAMRAVHLPESGPPPIAGRHVDSTALGRPPASSDRENLDSTGGGAAADLDSARDRLQRSMTTKAGVLRDAASMAEAAEALQGLAKSVGLGPISRAQQEFDNLHVQAEALLLLASSREESRGCHSRTDFPEAADDWRVRQVLMPSPDTSHESDEGAVT